MKVCHNGEIITLNVPLSLSLQWLIKIWNYNPEPLTAACGQEKKLNIQAILFKLLQRIIANLDITLVNNNNIIWLQQNTQSHPYLFTRLIFIHNDFAIFSSCFNISINKVFFVYKWRPDMCQLQELKTATWKTITKVIGCKVS